MSSDELEGLLDFAAWLARGYFAHAGEIHPHWIIQRADETSQICGSQISLPAGVSWICRSTGRMKSPP